MKFQCLYDTDGYIDVGDGCLRPNVGDKFEMVVTDSGYWQTI